MVAGFAGNLTFSIQRGSQIHVVKMARYGADR